MKVKIFSSLLCGFLTTTSFARVGENEQQVEARYGKPGKDLGTKGSVHQLGYVSGGFMILVDFVNGVSQREGFANPDSSPLSDDAIIQILRMNSPEGVNWRQRQGPTGDRLWRRSDEKAIALCPPPGLFVFVQDVNYNPPK
jgi:hypothetical protein